MAAWILKTEPTEYSFADLVKDGQTVWSGISNPTALIHLRSVKRGDTLVIYHTGKERQAVALARALTGPYADPKLADPKRVVIDIAPGKPLPRPVTLEEFKADKLFAGSDLVRLGRLSVVPLTDALLKRLLELAKKQ